MRKEGAGITLRPIAGTRPRGATREADEVLATELLADPKEIAEHVMLLDLGRNDVGRVAQTGTVQVTDRMVIERYSHVMHIVSNVEGTLKPGLTSIDVLRAAFPAGTVSGAPKVRAMEIIDELEPTRRGIYSGAVGYISFQDDMDTAIALRTAVIKNGMLYAQAGGGIVHDSSPEGEWQETLNKLRAPPRAADMVQLGLTRRARTMLLMIDNYDSFTYNLVQYLGELGADVHVQRNDAITLEQIAAWQPEKIVISPGPCTPDQAGISVALIERFAGKIPILGVCLGHQAIGQAFGGRIVRAQRVMHGKVSTITHDGGGVFAGVESPLTATRYHSLVIERESMPACLEVTATSEDGEIMGVRHRELAVEGVQFHPEAILTEHGHALLANFLAAR